MLRCLVVPLTAALLLGLPSRAPAGTLFDLGRARSDTLRAEQDPDVREIFPPNAFGLFPVGSFMWEEINVAPVDSLRWPEQVRPFFLRGFRIDFSDGGCGCGGFVERASTLRLTYNPEELAGRDIAESSLRVAFNYNPPINIYNLRGSRAWEPVEGAVPDLLNHRFEIPVSGDILGIREYAIVSDAFVPVEPVTWSRIKTLYGP